MDRIKIKILEDGTLSVETEGISGVNHISADEFLDLMEKNTGGTVEMKKKARYGTHTHGNLIHQH